MFDSVELYVRLGFYKFTSDATPRTFPVRRCVTFPPAGHALPLDGLFRPGRCHNTASSQTIPATSSTRTTVPMTVVAAGLLGAVSRLILLALFSKGSTTLSFPVSVHVAFF